jgi:hypothetical protein
MDVIKIYKYSLFLPFIIPAILAPAFFGLRSMGETVGIVFLSIIYSGLIGGIPYLILVVALFWWMRDKSEGEIRRALKISPLLMMGIFLVVYTLFDAIAQLNSLVNNRITAHDILTEFLVGAVFFSIFILIFGYSYVLLVFAIVGMLRKR